MSRSYETGHAKNAATFEVLISYCQNYGAAYQPGKGSLSLKSLQVQQQQTSDVMQTAIISKNNLNIATNERREVFANVRLLATKVLNAFAVSGAPALAIEDARGINRKLQGTRAVKKPKAPPAPAATIPAGEQTTPATPPHKFISASQTGYDNQIDHLSKLVQLLSTHASYSPNETELQVPAIAARVEKMKAVNTAFIAASTNWSNVQIQRYNIMYHPETGMVQTANEVKKYVLSVFGPKSPQYKQVRALKFIRFKGW